MDECADATGRVVERVPTSLTRLCQQQGRWAELLHFSVEQAPEVATCVGALEEKLRQHPLVQELYETGGAVFIPRVQRVAGRQCLGVQCPWYWYTEPYRVTVDPETCEEIATEVSEVRACQCALTAVCVR